MRISFLIFASILLGNLKYLQAQPFLQLPVKMANQINTITKTTPQVPVKQFTKIVSGYRYEITFDIENIPIPQEKGSYAKRLRIYDERKNYIVHEQVIYGNSLMETLSQRNSLELILINFDSIADVKISQHNQTYTYILSAMNEDSRIIFYTENLLTGIKDFTRNENLKQLVGKFYDGYFETTYTLKGVYFDTLIRFQQTLNKPLMANELFFLNKCEYLKNIENPNKGPVLPILKKEFGDYNFDGAEDFRIQCPEYDIEWNYYLFDKISNAYQIDTLLSTMQYAFFDWKTNKFIGSKSIRIDDLTQQFDSYEYMDGKLTVTKRRVCRQKGHYSERSDCTIYELKDGEMIITDFLPGAE